MDNYEKIIKKLTSLEREIERLKVLEAGWSYIPLTTPLTSTDFDGDAFSTTAKTKIDLSDKFGVPAGVKAVDVWINIRDSGSVNTYCYLYLSPNDIGANGKAFKADRAVNDQWSPGSAIIPCDANGDIYYQINASGADTFDMRIQIWGYWI